MARILDCGVHPAIMRIVVDGSTLQPDQTSAARYTEQLLRHLMGCPEVDLAVIAHKRLASHEPLPRALPVVWPRGRWPRALWRAMLAGPTLRRLAPDVAHVTDGALPWRAGVPLVVTLHALERGIESDAGRSIWRARDRVARAVASAAAVIVGSERLGRRVARHCGSDRRVHVVAAVPDPSFRPMHAAGELERVRRRYELGDRFVLYVGPVESNDCLSTLLEGFALRRRSRDLPLQLVCVGRYRRGMRPLEDEIERYQLESDVRFTGQVPFADMPALYNLAEMCVPGGLLEDDGLPLLESMACGTPVVADRALVPADLGPASVEGHAPGSAESVGDALARLAAHRSDRQRLASYALERVRTRTWARCARETIDVYRVAIANGRHGIPAGPTGTTGRAVTTSPPAEEPAAPHTRPPDSLTKTRL